MQTLVKESAWRKQPLTRRSSPGDSESASMRELAHETGNGKNSPALRANLRGILSCRPDPILSTGRDSATKQ